MTYKSIIRRSIRNRPDKIKMTDDILSQIDTAYSMDGAFIFKHMDDFQGEENLTLTTILNEYNKKEKEKQQAN